MRCSFAAFILLASVAVPAGAQPAAPQGAPFSVTHFSAQEYRAQPQNWSVAQDERGLMYVANNDGILQYDGARWRLIETGTDAFARSVAADSQGTVYAGAVGGFGVLRPDSTATLKYVSLAEQLPAEVRDFEDVWGTHAADDGVYFQARKRLFRWDGDTLRAWQSTAGFHTSFVVRGKLYVRDIKKGLLRMEDDALRRIPGGERFADVPVFVMLPREQKRILIGTRKEGFLLYDGHSFTPFPTEADPLLRENRLYHGCLLPGGEVALATLGGGVLIIDREGQLVRVLNQDTALPDGVVNHVYPDGQGGLWMALHNQGVVRAEVSSPLSRFGQRFGLEGIVYNLGRHANTLYAATGAGLYTLQKQYAGSTHVQRYRFEQVANVPPTWDVLSTAQDTLYAATSMGLYRVHGGTSTPVLKKRAFCLATTEEEKPRRLFVGTDDGLGMLRRHEDKEATFRLLASTKSEVRTIATTRSGALWFSTLEGAVLRLSAAEARAPAKGKAVRPQRFGPADGLPGGAGAITSLRGQPVFMSKQGLYRVRRTATDTTFYPDTTLARPSEKNGTLRSFEETASGSAWLFYDNRVEIVRPRPGGGFTRTAPPALQFPRSATVVRVHVEPDGDAWFSHRDELIRYDADRAARLKEVAGEAPTVLIRQVQATGTEAVIRGGAAPGGPGQAVKIPYRQNAINIAFALPQYGGETPPAYRYRLKKSEASWSAWAPSSQATLTHLYEGTYTFQVQARGEEGATLKQASFTFRVLPPWYRTLWAYLSYLTGVALLAVGYRRYRHLKRKSLLAEQQEHELKREREAREQLQEANERLEAANRLQENFLANTSHEFRTPLASIMGYAEILQTEDLSRDQQQDFLGIIRSNGDRLLGTVEMLLEMSQLSAGTLDLKPSRVEIGAELEQIVEAFRPEANAKGLDLRLTTVEQSLQGRLPVPHLRRIVENLVDNAIKFTPEGTVHITASSKEDEVHVEVRDTGIGIAEDEIDRLFGEFKQASEGIGREYEGIGLGLTIAARLARLMGGSIEVESTIGVGSTFTLRLPQNADLEMSTKSRPPEA